jgi:hypothetical protein
MSTARSSVTSGSASVTTRVQLLCLYGCYVFAGAFLVGWVFLAHFMPPPHPSEGARAIARMYRGRTTEIRLGMYLCMLSSALLLPWGGAVAVQMKRVEGRFSPLTYTWIAAQACIVIEFIYPCMIWATAAFRPESAPDVIWRFNDLGWLLFMGVISTGVLQIFALAAVVLIDKRPNPVFPRWFGYFQIFCGLVLLEPELVIFVKTGPLAWNGVLSYWVGFTTAFVWLMVTTVVTASAVKRQESEPDDDPMSQLAVRVAELEAITRVAVS